MSCEKIKCQTFKKNLIVSAVKGIIQKKLGKFDQKDIKIINFTN